MGPLFQKSGLRFECEMVDTVPCLPSIKTNPPYKQRVSCCHNHSHGIHVKPLLLAKIRDWCRIMPVGSTLRNAYRARKGDRDREDAFKVPQSFTFMQRQGWFFIAENFKLFLINWKISLSSSMPNPSDRHAWPRAWDSVRGESSTTPSKRWRCKGCLCNGQADNEWWYLVPATLAGLPSFHAGIHGKIFQSFEWMRWSVDPTTGRNPCGGTQWIGFRFGNGLPPFV